MNQLAFAALSIVIALGALLLASQAGLLTLPLVRLTHAIGPAGTIWLGLTASGIGAAYAIFAGLRASKN